MVEIVYKIIVLIYVIVTMSFESAVTIILTALAVMLAILAIGIAVMAIWGYYGFRDFVREAARKHVADAMAVKMKEYPEGTKVIEAMQTLIEKAKGLEGLQNQLVSRPMSNSVATTTEVGVQIQQYPGEESPDASHRAESAPAAATDARPDNR